MSNVTEEEVCQYIHGLINTLQRKMEVISKDERSEVYRIVELLENGLDGIAQAEVLAPQAKSEVDAKSVVHQIALSEEAQQTLQKIFDSPPLPTKELVELFNTHSPVCENMCCSCTREEQCCCKCGN